MSASNKYIAILATAIMLTVPVQNHAHDCLCTYTGGRGYEACYESIYKTPAIALAILALGTIVGFAFLRSSGGHAHN